MVNNFRLLTRKIFSSDRSENTGQVFGSLLLRDPDCLLFFLSRTRRQPRLDHLDTGILIFHLRYFSFFVFKQFHVASVCVDSTDDVRSFFAETRGTSLRRRRICFGRTPLLSRHRCCTALQAGIVLIAQMFIFAPSFGLWKL